MHKGKKASSPRSSRSLKCCRDWKHGRANYNESGSEIRSTTANVMVGSLKWWYNHFLDGSLDPQVVFFPGPSTLTQPHMLPFLSLKPLVMWSTITSLFFLFNEANLWPPALGSTDTLSTLQPMPHLHLRGSALQRPGWTRPAHQGLLLYPIGCSFCPSLLY